MSNAQVVRDAVDALGREDPEAFGALVHPNVDIETARGIHRGREAAIEWASKRYDHLVRRWAVEEIREAGDRLLVLGCVQYVWREGEGVGDETPTAIGFELERGQIRAMRIYESVEEGLGKFVVAPAEGGAR